MKRPLTTILLGLVTGLLTTHSTDADSIAKTKKKIGKTLTDMGDAAEDPAFIQAVKDLAHAAAAANPPAQADVASAAKIGEIIVEKKETKDATAPPKDKELPGAASQPTSFGAAT